MKRTSSQRIEDYWDSQSDELQFHSNWSSSRWSHWQDYWPECYSCQFLLDQLRSMAKKTSSTTKYRSGKRLKVSSTISDLRSRMSKFETKKKACLKYRLCLLVLRETDSGMPLHWNLLLFMTTAVSDTQFKLIVCLRKHFGKQDIHLTWMIFMKNFNHEVIGYVEGFSGSTMALRDHIRQG